MRLAAIALLSFTFAAPAFAQSWPAKPVRVLVPNAPGVSADILARALADQLQRRWNQAVVVENRPGASGIIAAEALVRSAPDGYTLLVHPAGVATFNHALYEKLPYDVLRDFAPITKLADTPLWIVVNPRVPAQTLKELLALAKSQPDKMSYSTVGGTIGLPYLASLLVHAASGARMVYVNYKAGSQAQADVIGGTLQVMYDAAPASAAHVKAGRLRALAVIAPKRMATFPDVPTIAEAGFPEATGQAWNGLSGRAGTPAETIRRIHSDTVAALREPALTSKMAAIGFEVAPMTPEEFRALIQAEMTKWGKVIRDNNIKPQ